MWGSSTALQTLSQGLYSPLAAIPNNFFVKTSLLEDKVINDPGGTGGSKGPGTKHVKSDGQSASDEHGWPPDSEKGGSVSGSDGSPPSNGGVPSHSLPKPLASNGQQVSQQRPSAMHPVSDPPSSESVALPTDDKSPKLVKMTTRGGAQFNGLSQSLTHRASSAAF